MKRYGMLFAFTLFASALILFSGQAVKKSILKTEIVTMEPISEEESVVCAGKVESVSDGNVYAPANAVSEKIFVKEGDRVSAGQRLMTVSVSSGGDVQKTFASYLPSSALDGFSQPAETTQTPQTLIAPADGTVTHVSVSGSGYYVDPSKPAVEIKSSTGLQVRLNVNEAQISGIQEGQKAEITGAGFKNSIYSGTVKEISSEAKQLITTTGQETIVEVLVGVDRPGRDIKPGFSAKAKIITSDGASVLVAPYEAVQADEDGKEYVLRVVGGKTVKTPVVTGREFDGGFEVKQGLSSGDRIVSNSETIQDGVRVLPLALKAGKETE